MRHWNKRQTGRPKPATSFSDLTLQPIDLILSGTSSSVAVYAAAASLSSEKNSDFFMWIVILGTLCSGLIVWLFGKTKLVFADATAYTIVALVSVLAISQLNTLAPDAIYTGPLMMAGVLSWMLVLGSFTVWRDQTMLFQAVPAVALFGLVGCYDTFRESVIYFFVFLVCQVTLLARAHGRVMLRQARSSGVEALEMGTMRKGPWRWMAGPEWALASALTIVLISVIGAPILRESASSFSGLVRYAPPMSPLTQSTLSPSFNGSTKVGTGPNALLEAPVMRVAIPEPMYLRSYAFGLYNGGAWFPRTLSARPAEGQPTARSVSVDAIKNPRRIRFRIEPLQVVGAMVAIPGEVLEITDDGGAYQRNMGGAYVPRGESPYPPLDGISVVADPTVEPKDTRRDIVALVPDYADKAGIPRDVRAYTQQVVKGSLTDYEKAIAIKRAIESKAKYNLDAAATPTGEDPVSYFLFKSKEGYCDLFASSMTLMARSAGLPARYVTGYYPFNSEKDSGGRYIVRQKDAHAWCEIFFNDAGWVVFDATEGAEAVEGSGRGDSNERPFWMSGWFIMIAIFAGGGGLGYGAFFAIKNYRQNSTALSRTERSAARASARIKRQVTKEFVSFEGEIRRVVKRPRGTGETINEYVEGARGVLGARSEAADAARSALATVLYAQPSADETVLSRLREKIKGFKSTRRGPNT